MTRIAIISIIVMALLSCRQDGVIPDVSVDERLLTHFEQFTHEAAMRGILLDFASAPVEGKIENIGDADVSGQCQHKSNQPNTVMIDLDYWERASGYEREFIVFHELGHCVLEREHLDAETQGRRCASIMHSGTSGCINAYSVLTRQDYLDELFSR